MFGISSAATTASTIAGPSTASAAAIAAASSSGFRAVNPWPPQARASAAKSGLGNSIASRNGTMPTLSASSVISPSAELL